MAYGLPDAIFKRDILHDPRRSPGEKTVIGDAFFGAGRFHDAMDFYQVAGSEAGADKVKRLAIDQGDAFLLGRAAEVLGEKVGPEDWRSLARRAFDLGKYRFAAKASERAGDEEGAARAREALDQALQQAKAEEEAFAASRRAKES